MYWYWYLYLWIHLIAVLEVLVKFGIGAALVCIYLHTCNIEACNNTGESILLAARYCLRIDLRLPRGASSISSI